MSLRVAESFRNAAAYIKRFPNEASRKIRKMHAEEYRQLSRPWDYVNLQSYATSLTRGSELQINVQNYLDARRRSLPMPWDKLKVGIRTGRR